jgi:hypothetical protein
MRENRLSGLMRGGKPTVIGPLTFQSAASCLLYTPVSPITGRTEHRLPKIVTQEKPPTSREEALSRWNSARKRFTVAIEKSRTRQEWLEILRQNLANLSTLAANEEAALVARDAAMASEVTASDAQQRAQYNLAEAKSRFQLAERAVAEHKALRPGFWSRLFRTAKTRAWNESMKTLSAAHAQSSALAAQLIHDSAHAEEAFQSAREARRQAQDRWGAATAARANAVESLRDARQKHGVVFADSEFFTQAHGQKHLSVPWITEEAQRVRDDVFEAALNLHRAFIDAAARPLRHNLGALMNVIFGQALPGATKEGLLPELWATLFLVVPLVSTTFASVGRMFRRLPVNSIGWLLVDEAGQALPQAAVGAIIRSRRIIVVGDPVQIEPVVVLPETLTHAIARRFGVDPDVYVAPAASAQTLADAASPFATEFPTRSGSRTVGVPLLVHRRCEEPMFGVSNAVAYGGLMVQAKTSEQSAIREALGPSTWIDVIGGAEDKWCPEEGAEVLRLLRALAQAQVTPDLYIVTPFVIVADRLRELICSSGVLRAWIPETDDWKWTSERIGTVHTVQGREAEAVIFVLGAPSPTQSGARGWAGGRPNLLNVAVTRAKEVLYVIGNRLLWREAGHFRELDIRLL